MSQITVSLALDLDMEYDPFKGRTPNQIAELLQDKLDDLVFEVDKNIRGVYTQVTNVTLEE